MMTRSAAAIFAKRGARSGPSMARVRRPGVNRAASRCQLSTSEVGQTTREGGRSEGRQVRGSRFGGCSRGGQVRQRLERLAETHLVGEDAAEAVARQQVQPAHAVALVRPHRLAEAGRQRHVRRGPETALAAAPLLPRRPGADAPLFQRGVEVSPLRTAQPVDAGPGLRGVAVAQDFREVVEHFFRQDGAFAVAQPPVPGTHLQQALDFRRRETLAAAAHETHLQLEPVLARAWRGDLRRDDLDLLADVREPRAQRDAPARVGLQGGQFPRDEAQHAFLATQKILVCAVWTGKTPSVSIARSAARSAPTLRVLITRDGCPCIPMPTILRSASPSRAGVIPCRSRLATARRAD